MKNTVLALTAAVVAGGFLYIAQPRAATMEEMRACTDDSQCVAVKGVCGAWSAIRKGRESAWDAYVRDIAPRADCARSQQGGSATAACREGRCTAIIEK